MAGHIEAHWTETTDETGRERITVYYDSPVPGICTGTYNASYYLDDEAWYQNGKDGFPQQRNAARNTFLTRKCRLKGGYAGVQKHLEAHPEDGYDGGPYSLPATPAGTNTPPAPIPQV